MLWICFDAILQRINILLLTRGNEHHAEKSCLTNSHVFYLK